MATEIRILEYDPGWPLEFQKEERKIRAALGGRALRVEHAGSTSVPGLAAKPVIDMVLEVADSADETNYLHDLEAAGYRLHLREPEWHQHRLLKGGGSAVNLHVFSRGCPEIDRMLAFRDWLRTHEEDRDRYARTKRELALHAWQRTQDYADAKTAVVREILLRAGYR